MNYSVSDAVSEVLSEMHFLQQPFKLGIVNYSALARVIKPLVEQKTGEEAGLDAIIMAIRRNIELLGKQDETKGVYSLLGECTLSLRTGMVCIHFKRTNELYKKVVEFEHNVNWLSGERIYVNQRTDEISVMTLSRFLPKFLEMIQDDPSQLLGKQESLAMLTIRFPSSVLYTHGFLHLLTSQFETLGINITAVFSSYSRLSFVCDEADAPAVYDRIAKVIRDSKKMEEMKSAPE
ncbi:hypothetical protein H0N96_00550 [Candidatus Micrarchaeota archaeon]|nr:hypothetical protein [Candidatus Micrarchaeota archaeon]